MGGAMKDSNASMGTAPGLLWGLTALGGLGVAALGTSVGFGVVASGQQSDGRLARARDTATVSDVFLGSSLALLVGATLLYFVEGRAVGTERVSGAGPASARTTATNDTSAGVLRPTAF